MHITRPEPSFHESPLSRGNSAYWIMHLANTKENTLQAHKKQSLLGTHYRWKCLLINMREPLIIRNTINFSLGKNKTNTTTLFRLKILHAYPEALALQFLVFSLCKEVFWTIPKWWYTFLRQCTFITTLIWMQSLKSDMYSEEQSICSISEIKLTEAWS